MCTAYDENKCCVPHCQRTRHNSRETKFYRFPYADLSRFLKWLQACKLDEEYANLSYEDRRTFRICADHFTDNSFLQYGQRTSKLSPTSCPTLFPALDSDNSPLLTAGMAAQASRDQYMGNSPRHLFRICCVPGCSNMGAIKFPSIKTRNKLRQLWIKSLQHQKPPGWQPEKSDRLCLAHFRTKNKKDRLRPKKKIIPIYFPWGVWDPDDTDEEEGRHHCPHQVPMEQTPDYQPVSRASVEFAIQLLTEQVKVAELQHFKDQCTGSYQVSENSMSAALDQLRICLLRHEWSDAAKILPHFFNIEGFSHMAWMTALQVLCHHPNSNAELLQEAIRTCLEIGQPSVPEEILKSLFTV